MLKPFITLVFLIQFIGHSQSDTTNFSYYFEISSVVYKQINGVDTRFYGKYTLKPNKHNELRIAAGDYFIIDSSGIYIEKNNLISISKAEVRENGKYNVVNGYLFGVIKNDSIPVVLQDDKYFFLMPAKSFLFDKTHHFMFKVNATSFLVFSKEDNGYYSLLKIDFNGSTLKLSELELNYQQIKQIKSKFIIENGFDTYLLMPLKNQWQLIINAFQVYDEYLKSK
jgi:hypothetical protein